MCHGAVHPVFMIERPENISSAMTGMVLGPAAASDGMRLICYDCVVALLQRHSCFMKLVIHYKRQVGFLH